VSCESNEKFGWISGLSVKEVQMNNGFNFNQKDNSNCVMITRQIQKGILATTVPRPPHKKKLIFFL
jgi:hypothetical protein